MDPGDERDIREFVCSTLATIRPSPAPLHSVVQAGKLMRTRRRIRIAASAVAVLTALAIGAGLAPGLLHRPGYQAPAMRPRPHRHQAALITIRPAGPHGYAEVIAYGRVRGRPWMVLATPWAAPVGALVRADWAVAAAVGHASFARSLPAAPRPGILRILDQRSVGRIIFGAVRPDVTRVALTLGNREVVQLTPVHRFGLFLVGVALPPHYPIIAAIETSRTGRKAYAVPFYGPGGTAGFYRWQPAGEPAPPRLTGPVFTGDAFGSRHVVTLYLGPWGWCAIDRAPGATSGRCGPQLPDRSGVLATLTAPGLRHRGLVVGAVPGSVAALVVTRTGGPPAGVPLARIGLLNWYALAMPDGSAISSWVMFNLAGRRIAAGHGFPA